MVKTIDFEEITTARSGIAHIDYPTTAFANYTNGGSWVRNPRIMILVLVLPLMEIKRRMRVVWCKCQPCLIQAVGRQQ
jgi:hypothetical protein